MSTLGIVFPGQGCQYVGMSSALCSLVPRARERFEEADDVLGYGLSALCHDGPGDLLDETVNTQPAVYTATVALWEYLLSGMGARTTEIACAAGHSLGEFAALTAAGALAFRDGVRLVRRRAEAMAEAGANAPGGMAAVLGLNDDVVHELVAEARARDHQVWVANYNSPGQVVVAGTDTGLAALQELAVGRKAKRVVPLAVSVACHTPLMGGAAEAFGRALAETPLHAARIPVISNVNATPQTDPQAIRAALMRQLVSPVRWVESVRYMAQLGVDMVVEVGPKAVLSGLIRRIDDAMQTGTLTDAASVDGWIASREAVPA
ncbi:MAG: ACP S-malonyltransferase [Anaerolineae bacterium]